ncbi:MAG: cytidylate kinase-like family protein [Armatimonadota bacterium]|nr:cytidylate kinase-like family protein [Armatimonadota bacterium]
MGIDPAHFEDIVAHRVRDWEIRQRTPQTAPEPAADMMKAITISRELGAGGNEVAEAVASTLGWDVWDRQLVEEIASKANVRREVVESVDEKTRGQIEAWVQELLGQTFGEQTYRRHLAEVVFTIARHGQAVIVGRGCNFILRKALNVRVIAPLPERVRRLAQREGISEAEAERRCQESDRKRREFVYNTFSREIADCYAYDLVLNTAQLPPADAAAAVVAAARARFQI